MKVSVDISLYPLNDDYCEPILDFIKRLESHDNICLERNTLSTQVFGEFNDVMAALNMEMEASLVKLPHSVFVIKLIGVDRQKSDAKRCE